MANLQKILQLEIVTTTELLQKQQDGNKKLTTHIPYLK